MWGGDSFNLDFHSVPYRELHIDFITLRRRNPKLLQEVYALPRSAWRQVELEVPTRQFRTPRIYEQSVKLADHVFRQIFVLASGLCDRAVVIPWWQGKRLRLTTYTGR